MAEQRLPAVNSDDGIWGEILNQYITKEHYNTGINNAANGGHKTITIRPGTVTAGTAPLKFTSGDLMTAPEAGAVEFNNDRLYFTQTTNTTRKVVAAFDDSSGATGDMYYRDSNGNFIRMGVGSQGQMLVAGASTPAWTTVLSGTAKITVGTSEPSTPTTGDLWIDTN